MSEPKIRLQPIHLHLTNADAVVPADHAPLFSRFASLAAAVNQAWQQRADVSSDRADVSRLIAVIGDFLPLMQSLDTQYGADGELPMADAVDAIDEVLHASAALDGWLERLEITGQRENLHALQLGSGYWAMRHHLPLSAVAPLVNALATQSNRAESRQETAAVYALMQGFIQHLEPALHADLERSNPERPWRLLNLNFAITAIRTGDAAMMRFAFDTLNAHLPDECGGFYEEAAALAADPRFPPETRALIEGERAKWARVH